MGFSLGGIMKSLVNPMSLMQLAMGPAGWASLAMKMIGSAIGQQVIQMIGQKLGLPEGIINIAQQGFAAATGTQGMPSSIRDAASTLASQMNLSPSQQGNLERTAEQAANDIYNTVANFDFGGESSNKASGKQSWVMALVKALGPKLDKLAGDMTRLAGQSKDSPSKATEFQAVSQEFNLLMTSLSGAIKTIGEAQAATARKG